MSAQQRPPHPITLQEIKAMIGSEIAPWTQKIDALGVKLDNAADKAEQIAVRVNEILRDGPGGPPGILNKMQDQFKESERVSTERWNEWRSFVSTAEKKAERAEMRAEIMAGYSKTALRWIKWCGTGVGVICLRLAWIHIAVPILQQLGMK